VGQPAMMKTALRLATKYAKDVRLMLTNTTISI